MRAKHLVPNAVTLANIVFGFLGIVAASEGKFTQSCFLLFAGALCDMSDGKLARLLNATSKFGMELDSLSDAISFGLAPAFLVYCASLKELGTPGLAIAALYVLCGVLRLARFNVTTSELSKATFLGCPIPAAGGYIISMVLVRESMPLWLLAFGTTFVALGMVSTLKVPKFGKGGPCPQFMLYLGMATFIALLAWPGALTWHLWNGWNMVMLGTNYVMLHRRGLLGAGAAPALANLTPGPSPATLRQAQGGDGEGGPDLANSLDK